MFLGYFRTANSLEHFVFEVSAISACWQQFTEDVDKDRQSTSKVAGFLPRICFSRANKTLGLFSLHAKRYLFTVKL